MKINWGTGIFIFMLLFVITAISFVIYTLQFDANLVHEDYYEKGVDYSEQMRIEARSIAHGNAFQTSSEHGKIEIKIEQNLSTRIDSGNLHVFRPSDRRMDLDIPIGNEQNQISVPPGSLINGRYILQITWYMDGVKYEVDKTVIVQ